MSSATDAACLVGSLVGLLGGFLDGLAGLPGGLALSGVRPDLSLLVMAANEDDDDND